MLRCYDSFEMPFSDSFWIRSGAYSLVFSFHTQGGQITDSTRIARNKKRLALRLIGYKRSPAGHYQPFKHPHVTRSPPIGIAKLSEIFMNVFFSFVD